MVSKVKQRKGATPKRRDVLLVCLIDLGSQVLGQGLVVDSHGLAATSSAGRHGHLGEGIPGFIAFLGEARNDADGGIVLVERSCQLLSGLCQLLLQFIRLQGERVPLVLKGREKGGNGGQRGRSGVDDSGGLDGQKILEVELVAGDGILAVLFDILLDESLFEDGA